MRTVIEDLVLTLLHTNFRPSRCTSLLQRTPRVFGVGEIAVRIVQSDDGSVVDPVDVASPREFSKPSRPSRPIHEIRGQSCLPAPNRGVITSPREPARPAVPTFIPPASHTSCPLVHLRGQSVQRQLNFAGDDN